ncbi:uncharacterized protein LOC133069254 isoform X4 [Dama dama]|uniref:uncharacterized protein LOC133069254 isoform X4 n=1 Tax=Dama dama TaxID=30532 RepID=UPI002A369605|nr:uncharacterized protein LOC133069254 isoform X4 [Dama dama]
MSDLRSTSLETGRQTAKSREPGEGHSRQVRTQRPSSPCGRLHQTQEPFLRREALAAMGASASKWPHGYWPLPEDLSATWDPPSRRLEAGATSLGFTSRAPTACGHRVGHGDRHLARAKGPRLSPGDQGLAAAPGDTTLMDQCRPGRRSWL